MSKTMSNSNEFQEDKHDVMEKMGSFWAGALVVDRVAHLGWWPGKNSPRRCHLSSYLNNPKKPGVQRPRGSTSWVDEKARAKVLRWE